MFRELYYWAYTIYSKKKRFKGYVDLYTFWLITGLQALNYVILLFVIDYLFIITCHFSFMSFLFKGKGKSPVSFLFAGILGSPIFLYTYFQLERKKKEIIQHYKNKKMSQFRQDWGKLFFWLYVIFSLVSFFVAGFIFRKLRSEAGM